MVINNSAKTAKALTQFPASRPSIKIDATGIEQRETILQILLKTGRGHIGSAFSLLEITRVLFDDILRYNPKQPAWPDRDRFVLSKGHGCLGLYVQLVRSGFIDEEELWRISDQGAMLGGHPEYGLAPGIEASTGSLGHGLPIAVGIALSGRLDKKDFRTFCLIGDGECNEGSIWEAALAAKKHHLSNLTVLVDYNKLQCYGPTEKVQPLEPLTDKWRAFGFNVEEVDGHDTIALRGILESTSSNLEKPNAIICHTIKGKGISVLENNPTWHHKSRVPAADIENLITLLRSENAKDLS